jgi:hypothetical protein
VNVPKPSIDTQTLLGLLSATGLPPLFHAIIAFVHPAIYTLSCGQIYVDGAASCYRDACVEAIIWIVLSLVAVGYGLYAMSKRLAANPTPTNVATVPTADGGTVTISTVAAPQQKA